MSDKPKTRAVSYLTTADFTRLNTACLPIRECFGFGSTYLVGSVMEDESYRDVDVRVILKDEDFDRLFGHAGEFFWSLFCLGVTSYLERATGLPIDFQVQRMTEANEKYGHKMRNPIGTKGRPFAGGGDATVFAPKADEEDAA